MKSERPGPDLRVRRTRKLLLDALLDLVMEKDLDTITVTEICHRAMVHRTTFYSHFRDKYDLLHQGMEEVYDRLLIQGPPLEKAPSRLSWNQPPPHFVHIFERAGADHALYRRLLCSPGVPAFREYLREFFVERTHTHLERLATAQQDVPLPLAVHFNTGAIVETLSWWLENDCPYSASDMALYTMRLMLFGTYPALGIKRENNRRGPYETPPPRDSL